MEIGFAEVVLNMLTKGGASAVIALLFAVVIALLFERRHLIKRSEEQQDKLIEAKDKESETIEKIVERYHQGNLDLVHALNEIKIVLSTINKRGG